MSDRDAWMAAGQAAYEVFIESLLEVADNLVYGADGTKEVVHPDRVVRHDGDDYYLVVAADKGTARFSDVANAIAERRDFWLGDRLRLRRLRRLRPQEDGHHLPRCMEVRRTTLP